MAQAELDAAGITDPHLRHAYHQCRELNAAHGRTFFLATTLLAPSQRPPVHALYGLARAADDVVDEPWGPRTTSRALQLENMELALFDALEAGESEHPILAAVVDTIHRYGIPRALFEDFFYSMRMDLSITGYPDRAALDIYMRGSAESIGAQLVPILGSQDTAHAALPYAAALGKAFQLTNFLRDIAEDLDRGRVYLPADELSAFGVDRELLAWCRAHGRTDSRVRAALADQHATTRAVYRFASSGIDLLHPVSQPCVRTALVLYSEILDRIESASFNVFRSRATVGRVRRAHVAGVGLARALWARYTNTRPGPVVSVGRSNA